MSRKKSILSAEESLKRMKSFNERAPAIVASVKAAAGIGAGADKQKDVEGDVPRNVPPSDNPDPLP